MNKLRNIILIVGAIITLVMMAATLIESQKGSDFACTNIYRSWWFVALWGIFAMTGCAYTLKRKLYKRLPIMMIHVAFIVILLGAFTSWLTSESGSIHIRKGSTTKTMELNDESIKTLNFSIKLKDFKVINYPGTDAPMDYISEIVIDNEPIDISMNNIGTYKGYRFLQAGYDSDMQGTRLGVYHDPWGIAITYIGYFLLFISLIMTLFSKKTRMRGLYQKAINMQTLKAILVALLLAIPSLSQQINAQQRVKMDKDLANEFGKICVLYNSRICPINTVAINFVSKLSGKPTWDGLSANEIFMGWVFDVSDWEHEKMIEIKDKEVQAILGIKDKWASFDDFWNQYNEYKLEKPLAEANYKGDKARLKKLREVDEKFNVIRMLYNGEMLRMFPYTTKEGNIVWLSPGECNKYGKLPGKEWNFVRRSMDITAENILGGNKEQASILLGKIYDYQHIRGAAVIPSTPAVYAELTYNTINTQRWPIMLYLTLSLLLIIASTIWAKKEAKTILVNKGLIAIMLIHTTILLLLRWVVSGHLPMSNGYETMQFMAWAVLIVTLISQKRFPIILRFGPLLSAFALLVAMITDDNPQITQLMPVLQSPLLSLHVMVIMFSYALFGLMALIGIQGLVAHQQKATNKEAQLAALSQFLLYPATALLTIGIFIGAIWANISWGRYWGWDSKEVWALITMLIYAVPLHGEIKWIKQPLHVHIYMLLAFLSVLMTYFGVNYFLAGMHSYA